MDEAVWVPVAVDPLVPPARLGALLVEGRRAQGLDVVEMARRSNGMFTTGYLENAERGRVIPDDQIIERLVGLYEVHVGPIIPPRNELLLDIDQHLISVGDQSMRFESLLAEDVLDRYVSLIYRLRNQTPGSQLTLRDLDLDVLATGLGYTTADVRHEIFEIIGAPDSVRRAQQVGKGRIFLAAGLLFGLTVAGAAVLLGVTANDEAPSEVLGVSQTIVASGFASEIGAQAEAAVPFDFRSVLDDWQIGFADAHPDFLGVTLSDSRTITVHVQEGATVDAVAGVLMHEVGHAIDLEQMTDSQRAEWIALRGIPATWWPGNGLSDFAVGAGDFAEAVAAYTTGSPSSSVYGDFTDEQLAFVAEILSAS